MNQHWKLAAVSIAMVIAFPALSAKLSAVTSNVIIGNKPDFIGDELGLIYQDGTLIAGDLLKSGHKLNSIKVSTQGGNLQFYDEDNDPPDPQQPYKIITEKYSWSFNNGPVDTSKTVCQLGTGELKLVAEADIVAVSQYGYPKQGDVTRLILQRTFPVAGFLRVNGSCFGLNDDFPSTAFSGARFTIELPGGSQNYQWDIQPPGYAVVDGGIVTFIAGYKAPPLGKTLTITATQKGMAPFGYNINVKKWFHVPDSIQSNWNTTKAKCSALGYGYRLPRDRYATINNGAMMIDSEVVNNKLGSNPLKRQVGALIPEWGRLDSYNKNVSGGVIWTSSWFYWLNEHREGSWGAFLTGVSGTDIRYDSKNPPIGQEEGGFGTPGKNYALCVKE